MGTTSEMCRFDAGEVILEEGGKIEGFYILKSGKVGVYQGEQQIAEIEVEAGGERTFLGDMSNFTGEGHSATVKALSECRTIRFGGNVKDIITDHPDLALELFETLAARLVNTTRKVSELEAKLKG